MNTDFGTRVSRRLVLRGTGVGVLGLASAALLGCGSTGKTGGGGTSKEKVSVEGSTRGAGLPMVAPKVAGKIKPGGTYTTAVTSTYVQNDAHTALAGNIYHIIGEKALEPDPVTNAIRPHLFTSWEVADPAGTTLVFKLHPKLYTHDIAPYNGRQFTAEDAAWNLMRIGGLMAKGGPFEEKNSVPLSQFQRASMVANITKAEVVDPLTVKVTLSKPNSAFFSGLTENRVPFMPKEVVDVGLGDPLKLGGIGPFQVVDWKKDQKTSFKKNPRYAEFRQNEPYFDKFEQIVVPDTASTQAAFASGQIGVVAAATPEVIALLRKARPDANLYTAVDQNWQHIRPSLEYAPFKDIRVRKALFLTGDYKAMAEGYYGDGWTYQAALNPMFPEAWGPDKVKALPGYNPDTKQKDREEAAKLLTAAGYPNGKGLDWELIVTQSSEVNRENATRFQAQIMAAFPEAKFRIKLLADSAALNNLQNPGNFQMVSYTITSAPDAVIEFTSQYHSQGSRNYGHFKEPVLDALMDKAIVELKRENRTAMLEEAQRKFMDEWMPMYVLYAQPRKEMVQGNIGGYDTTFGIAFGYSANTKICRWYYVDK